MESPLEGHWAVQKGSADDWPPKQSVPTSSVKSTWPGVSMMLMRCLFQVQVVAALVMVMPRSCSQMS